MVAFTIGSVVLVPFPFSDLSASKLRPALLLAASGRGDWISAQITSNPYSDPEAIKLTAEDFISGGLDRTSYARPGKLFTANENLFRRTAGVIRRREFLAVIDTIVVMLRDPSSPATGSNE